MTTSTAVIPAVAGDGIEAAIRREHSAATSAATAALGHALECGRLLAEAREGIEHGAWETFVRERCDIAPRTARVYLRLHANRERLANRQHVAGLTVREAVRELTVPRERPVPAAGDVVSPRNDELSKRGDTATADDAEGVSLLGPAPDWYAPKHFHSWIHPSGWRIFVWPHPAGEPYVHFVTLDPVGDPRPDADHTIASGPKRGVHVGAVVRFIRMQRVNGMPMLTDPKWVVHTRLVPDELIAGEPYYNQWLFYSEDDYRQRGMGIEPRRKTRQGAPA